MQRVIRSQRFTQARTCAKRACPTPETHDSHGTAHCAQLAEKAGIPVQWYRY